LAAEDLRESADREEKAGRRGDPARAVLGERAAGDDTVQMQVLGEILAPGVQNRRAADIAAEMARIAGEGGERGRDRAEEQRVDDARIALSEWVQRVRQREHHVEIVDGEQLGAPGGEPALFRQGLALRAVAVTAGVVGEALGPARFRPLRVGAEGGVAGSLARFYTAPL